MKIENCFMTEKKTMAGSLLIFIRPIRNHTTRKRPMNILILKLCHTKMTIPTMILKKNKTEEDRSWIQG